MAITEPFFIIVGGALVVHALGGEGGEVKPPHAADADDTDGFATTPRISSTHGGPLPKAQSTPDCLITLGQQFCFVVRSPRREPAHTSGSSAHCRRDWPHPVVQQTVDARVKLSPWATTHTNNATHVCAVCSLIWRSRVAEKLCVSFQVCGYRVWARTAIGNTSDALRAHVSASRL